ncbi:MAG: flagellar FlbD family protein [Georgenia sp.]
MIIVRRLTGQPFAINPDLIERIECTPDTILVLLDGTRYIVNESLDEIVSLVQEHRAAIVARSLQLGAKGPGALDPASTDGATLSGLPTSAASPREADRHDAPDADNVIVSLPTRPRGDQ